MGALLDREVDMMVLNDGILPSQLDAQTPQNPERRLWAAVLDGVKTDLKLRGTVTTKRYKASLDATRDWLADDLEAPGSFRWICAMLGLDPDYTARSLRGAP